MKIIKDIGWFILFVAVLVIGWTKESQAGMIGDWIDEVTEEQDYGC